MENTSIETPGPAETWHGFLIRKLPYIALLALTIGGVAFTSIANTPLVRYWEILAVLTGLLCIFTAWPHYDGQGRMRLILRQSAHWLAIIVAMRIVLMPGIQTMFTGPATGYALLLLLALGTFLAGLNISLELCVLGLVMATAVPAMLWLKQTALLAVLIGAAGVALFAILWRRK